MSGLTCVAIAPLEWAKVGRQVSGMLPLASMGRLRELLVDDAGSIDVVLAGQMLAGGKAVLTGSVAGTVTVRCQRCLEPLAFHIEAPIRLGVLGSDDDLDRLPDGHDPLICPADQEMPLIQLIEDELLLALPDHPHHADGMCSASAVPAQQVGKRRPFAALASLRKNDPPGGLDD